MLLSGLLLAVMVDDKEMRIEARDKSSVGFNKLIHYDLSTGKDVYNLDSL